MMLCGIAAVNAQTSTNDVTFVNNGSTYGNGDTMIVSVERTAIGIEGIGLKNNTSATLEDVRFAMTMGLMPVTGITLPFLSGGGTSVLASMIAVGVILNVGVNSKKITF